MPTLTNLLEEEQPKKPIAETQPAPQPAPSYPGIKIEQNKGLLGDIGTSLQRGLLDLPSTAAGLADIPFAAAFGRRPVTTAAEFLGEKTGFQPAKKAEALTAEYSPELQKQQAEISAVWQDPTKSGLDIAKAYLKRPATIASTIAESVPSMIAGGGVGRAVSVGAKLSAPLAAGIGEGLVSAGQTMSQAEGEDQKKNALAALTSGVITAAIGAGAGKVARNFNGQRF